MRENRLNQEDPYKIQIYLGVIMFALNLKLMPEIIMGKTISEMSHKELLIGSLPLPIAYLMAFSMFSFMIKKINEMDAAVLQGEVNRLEFQLFNLRNVRERLTNMMRFIRGNPGPAPAA